MSKVESRADAELAPLVLPMGFTRLEECFYEKDLPGGSGSFCFYISKQTIFFIFALSLNVIENFCISLSERNHGYKPRTITCPQGLIFPESWKLHRTLGADGKKRTLILDNDVFPNRISDEDIRKKMTTNAEYIQKFAIPWMIQHLSLEAVIEFPLTQKDPARHSRLCIALMHLGRFQEAEAILKALPSWVIDQDPEFYTKLTHVAQIKSLTMS